MSARMDGVYTLGILGGGRAAWAFGATWRRLGWPIDGVWLRPESRSRLPELLETPRKKIEDLDADLLLIAVSDRAIEEVVERAKDAGGRAKGEGRRQKDAASDSLSSGSSSSDSAAASPSPFILRPSPFERPSPFVSPLLFHASGALPAPPGGFSLHPLKSLPPVGEPSDLRGSLLVFQGEHRPIAERVAEACGARFAEITAQEKVRYHAGAVFGSNYMAALLDIAEELVGIDGARDDLANLPLSAVENWRANTDCARFTGPAARGDVEVLERHLAALADRPELAEIYRLLAARILATRK